MSIPNIQVLKAILCGAEHGCKWRGLPSRFGNWHTIYTRMNRRAKAGVLDRVFTVLQEQQVIRIKIEAMSIDSTIAKVHPDGTQAIGESRGVWTTNIHMAAADARTAIASSLSPGQRHDGPEGRKLLRTLRPAESAVSMIMDRAYGGDETRQLVLELGFTPVVPPTSNPVDQWEYDRIMYRRLHVTGRLSRRLCGGGGQDGTCALP